MTGLSIDNILPNVQRPSRYLGKEINAIRKDSATIYIALVFPDLYEIGMSHLGLKILYHILNQQPDIAAERLFAPDLDYEALLRKNSLPITSLESSRPLNKFDLIGFTLQYELSYTNILNILDLGHLPLRAADRDRDLPLVIAGGPGAFNPEPLSPFIDLFVIGEGEEIILEIVDTYRQWRDHLASKDQLLEQLQAIRGVYVPSLSRVLGNPKVSKRFVRNLDLAPFPSHPIVPYCKVVHDRIVLEIARGCTQGCRFCQAGIIYRPLRERSPSIIKRLVAESLLHTGYDEISLVSLNTGGYSCLTPLVVDLMQELTPQRVSLSLPSLRPGSLNLRVLSEIGKVRKTGFTLVPEAGTERLRKVINKEMGEDQILSDVYHLLEAGWDTLKLYFMIGLPTETTEDIEGIISLSKKILALGSKGKKRLIRRISLSLSPFVPKPHTPFQWFPQDELLSLKEKLRYIRHGLKDHRFIVRWQAPEMSLLEAVIALGDRKVGEVIENAFQRGCRFDSWTERLDFPRWLEAFHDIGLDLRTYANSAKDPTVVLSWDHIDTGVKKDFLRKEWGRAQNNLPTLDCRMGQCLDCGMACPAVPTQAPTTSTIARPYFDHREPKEGRPEKIRLKLEKKGLLRHLSHLEFQQVFYRACRRSQIPIHYSQGFRPNPKVSFGPALPVGVESEGEFVDLELSSGVRIMSLIGRLNSQLPAGLRITAWKRLSPKSVPISLSQENFKYKIEISQPEAIKKPIAHECLITNLLQRDKVLISREKDKKTKILDIRPLIVSIKLIDESNNHICLEMVLKNNPQGSAKPKEVLKEIYGEDITCFSSIEIKKLSPDYF
jgi:radical SAM family uncharacterized protein/radical SAM-linked protein